MNWPFNSTNYIDVKRCHHNLNPFYALIRGNFEIVIYFPHAPSDGTEIAIHFYKPLQATLRLLLLCLGLAAYRYH